MSSAERGMEEAEAWGRADGRVVSEVPVPTGWLKLLAFIREFQFRRHHIQHFYLNLAGPSERGHTVTACMQGMDGTSARVIDSGKNHKFK